jgi:sodium-dependent dicarboxylate transporter 2/3/5
MPNKMKCFISIVIPLLVCLVPTEMIPIKELSLIEHRIVAIFILATLLWVLEPIPVWSTSVLIIGLELFMVSDKAFFLFKPAFSTSSHFGTSLGYKIILASFASPIIMLFIGGFFLAMVSRKYQLDLNLARVIMKPFGSRPKYVLLGLMIITAAFSMFMSNTATAAMMMAMLTPVLAAFEKDDPGKVAIVLGIPFAANIGGIGTPIGTPPNAIAMKYLNGSDTIDFGMWMLFAVPFVMVMLVLVWQLLLRIYPVRTKKVTLTIEGRFLKNWKALTVYITFALTILLWLTGKWHGMNSYVVAMVPVVVFSVTGIVTAQDLKTLSWDVLWLVAGGIALGMALEQSGLSVHLIQSIPFDLFSGGVIVIMASLLAIFMSSFISNTATANLLLPVMAALGTNVSALQSMGGAKLIIIAVAFACSLAMALPISTPPNAIAHASGLVQSRQMVKPGLIIGLMGLVLEFIMLFILHALKVI